MKVQSQRGVALVVTLIMLSVITFLTVAFLAITRRDKASMTTSSSQTDAKLASDVALARAQSEIIAQIVAKQNMLVGDLLVSRSYVNQGGFVSGNTNLDNVNYLYPDGKVLNDRDQVTNIGNLFYDSRVPVYVPTNELGSNDFRYYYDWNRNRRPDTNGLVPVIVDEDGNTNGTLMNALGDPEFIGILEKPEFRHSGTNRFPSRYAYIVLPEGNSLDINFIHNYGKFSGNMAANDDGYLRNQGVGSWEINLGGFLAGLNTNYYGNRNLTNGYAYSTNLTPAVSARNLGGAFDDALAILSYRYGTNSTTLSNAVYTLGASPTDLQNDQIDHYANGPLQQYHTNITDTTDSAVQPWPGSKSANAFFEIGDLFNVRKSSPAFVARLSDMGARTNSYDRYSFQRLMGQIGTHSTPATNVVIAGKNYKKLNLNYNNLTAPTNFVPWKPVEFFTNAAELMIQKSLQRGANFHVLGGIQVPTNFSLANIEIYPNNRYTPTLHRLLQLAANTYAATATTNYTARAANGSAYTTNFWPFVFRPIFSSSGTNIYITGYEEVTSTNALSGPYIDLLKPVDRARITSNTATNVYGVPWVISARKGMPNFNEFTIETDVQVTRRLQFRKNASYKLFETNQMYTIAIQNRVGFEFWNSYTQAFPLQLTVLATNEYVSALTNEAGTILTNSPGYPNYAKAIAHAQPYVLAGAALRGEVPKSSFVIVTNPPTMPPFLAESQYTNHPGGPFFKPATTNKAAFDSGKWFYIPDWDLVMTNRIVCALTAGDRVIDFVNIDNIVTTIDITAKLYEIRQGEPPGNRHVWQTNRWNNGTTVNVPTIGVLEQIQISMGRRSDADWSYSPSTSTATPISEQTSKFAAYLEGGTPMPTNLVWEAPFSPTRRFYERTSFQVNDPMVHYMAGDMINPETPVESQTLDPGQAYPDSNLAVVNQRYNPWGGKRTPGSGEATSAEHQHDPAFKDPLVRWSDDWDFPTNKFPSIGWLGRVHRGTPWQSVYLKSKVAATNEWFKWAGSLQSHPTNDWFLLDLFTAAPNDNAARGLLSVNQSGLASWSAVLSGVIAISNSAPSTRDLRTLQFEPVVIDPTIGTNIQMIVDGVNRDRADTNRHPDGVYSTLGEVLAAPELTVASPFLNKSADQLKWGINDVAYERIPQQILSLLKTGEARFVVYAIGQSLKPAPNSFVFDSGYQNMCTNYQITGEVAARAVMRVEGSPQNPKVVIESYSLLPEE